MIAHSAVARNARNILSPQLLGILAQCTDFALGKARIIKNYNNNYSSES